MFEYDLSALEAAILSCFASVFFLRKFETTSYSIGSSCCMLFPPIYEELWIRDIVKLILHQANKMEYF